MEERTLCWYCKKATADCNNMCQWLHKNKPLKNWVAEQGNLQRYRDIDGTLHRGYAYTVKECPYFERDTEWLDYSDVVKDVSKYFNFKHYSSFYADPLRWLKKYHDETGKNIPEWVIEEVEYLSARPPRKSPTPTNADNEESSSAPKRKRKRKEYKLTEEDYQELIAGGFDPKWL